MKYKLFKPHLNSYDLARLNFYADYMGYTFKFNKVKQSALFEVEGDDKRKTIAYIQKDEYKRIFLVWRETEEIQYIDEAIELCIKLDYHNILDDTLDRINMMIGIHECTGNKVTRRIMNWIKKDKSNNSQWMQIK